MQITTKHYFIIRLPKLLASQCCETVLGKYKGVQPQKVPVYKKELNG